MNSTTKWLLILVFVALLIGVKKYIDWNTPPHGKFSLSAVTLQEVPGQNLKKLVGAPLVYTDPIGNDWTAVEGTLTDGASIPRFALWITDDRFQEEFLKAAIVHDAYCQEFNKSQCQKQYRTRPHAITHRMFYEGCLAGNTDPTKALIMYSAVLWGGPTWGGHEHSAFDLSVVPDDMRKSSYRDCEKWIESNKPTIDDLDKWTNQRIPVVVGIAKLQSDFMAAIQSNDLDAAEASQNQAEVAANAAIKQFSKDTMFKNLVGYNHKNRAVIYQQKSLRDQKEAQLVKAQEQFERVLIDDPANASAKNGLGSIEMMRGNFVLARQNIEEALKIDPNYQSAKKDLQLLNNIEKGSPIESTPIQKRPLTRPAH